MCDAKKLAEISDEIWRYRAPTVDGVSKRSIIAINTAISIGLGMNSTEPFIIFFAAS